MGKQLSKLKQAKAMKQIAAIYGNMKQPIEKGQVVSYERVKFYNGETWLVLVGGTMVPDIFFDTEYR